MSFDTFYNMGYEPVESQLLANGAGKKRGRKAKGSGVQAPISRNSNLGVSNVLNTIMNQLGTIIRFYTKEGGAVSGGAESGGAVSGGKRGRKKKMEKEEMSEESEKEESESDEEGGAVSGGKKHKKRGGSPATGGKSKASLLKKVMAYKWKNGCSLKEAWDHFK